MSVGVLSERSWSVEAVCAELRTGRTSAADLLESCLSRIEDPEGEGGRVFLHVSAETARAAARAADRQRTAGVPPGPLVGLPVSVKDLFDVAGERTTAGSRVLADAAPADRDSPAIERLRAAGAVLVGRTNMTEFAYSGVGMNPHFDTPRNPYDRDTGRIPGGSSSGAAVSVAERMALAAIGTDTGGSCRVPAALCGLTGFKPTASRIPLNGVVPLSTSFDSVGVLAATVHCVALVDAVLAGERVVPLPELPLGEVRLLAVRNLLLDEIDEATARAFDRTLSRLNRAGIHVVERRLPSLDIVPELVEKGGIVAAEAHAWHEPLLRTHGDQYDPRVRTRILMGAEQSATEYIRLLETRVRLQTGAAAETAGFDAIVAPTTPIIAPPFSAFADDTEYMRLNSLLLRNTLLANMLDGCSISVPCHDEGDPPVGLMLIGPSGSDRRLLTMAAAIERELGRAPYGRGSPGP